MRNHNTMKRDAIIKMVAGLVGQPHKVDLKNYDLLITIEIYQVCVLCWCTPTIGKASVCADNNVLFQNICGVSVVDHRFEELKRYNISEIFDPTPKEDAPKVEKGDETVKETVKDEKLVDAAETGMEAAADAKPTTDDNEGASSAVKVKDEASSAANEAKTGQDDEGGVSAVQDDDVQASAPDASSGAP
jgi:hypothetical protein